MATASRSANVTELQRMFSNFDSTVIASVLAANNGLVDVTIDHLLTMSIDTENENNIQQSIPTTLLRPLPAVPNIYDDDPPPYPGHEAAGHSRTTTMASLPLRSRNNSQTSRNRNLSATTDFSSDAVAQRDIQVQRWKTPYGQYRICYTGDLSDDFLRVKLFSTPELNSQSKNNTITKQSDLSKRYIEDEYLTLLLQNTAFLQELRHNKEFLTTLDADEPAQSSQRRSSHQFSTKSFPLPTPPTVETPKTPKIRARMLQNALTQIEQGQAMRTSMVPEESITQNEGYTYGKDNKEKIPLPPAPSMNEFDPLRLESNEEFIGRLKHMGKNSMEKFNQLARRFSTRKSSTTNTVKYSKQPMMLHNAECQLLTNEFDTDDDRASLNKTTSNRYLASV